MKYQVTQTYEQIYVYEVEAASEADALLEVVRERAYGKQLSQRQTLAVEKATSDRSK